MARLWLFEPDYDRAIEVGARAASLAEEVAAEDARAHALNTVGTARAYCGDWGGVGDVERSLEIALQINSAPDVIRGYNNLSAALGWLGDVKREQKALADGLDAAERFGEKTLARFLRGNLPASLYRAGNWEDALRAADAFLGEIEAGLPSMLEHAPRDTRARIWFARGDVVHALEESGRAVDAARANSPLEVAGILASHARMKLASGHMGDVTEAVEDILEAGRGDALGLVSPDAALLFLELGRSRDLLAGLERAPAGYWRDAARLVAKGELEDAADLFASRGEVAAEADVRLAAARRLASGGRRSEADEQLQKALAFYRSVGATRYVREGEALLAASA